MENLLAGAMWAIVWVAGLYVLYLYAALVGVLLWGGARLFWRFIRRLFQSLSSIIPTASE